MYVCVCVCMCVCVCVCVCVFVCVYKKYIYRKGDILNPDYYLFVTQNHLKSLPWKLFFIYQFNENETRI